MKNEPGLTRSGAARPMQSAAPHKSAKRSAPPTDPATKAAFGVLVESIYAWFKAREETVPIQGFAALVARSRQATTTECTDAEKRALGALTGLAKHDDEATWSLLRTFAGGGGMEQFMTSFNSARIRVTRKAEAAANVLKKQKKAAKMAAANANKKRGTDDQPARNEGSKKAKLAANDTQPKQPLRGGEAGARDVQVATADNGEDTMHNDLRDEFQRTIREELRDLEARMTTRENELRRQHALERNDLNEELQRLSTLLATNDAALNTTRNEVRALRQGQVFLARRVKAARVTTAASLQSVQTAEKREPHVWLSHVRLTAEMLDGPLMPIPNGYRGLIFLYILDRFINKPILHDPHGIYPYPVPAGTWVDAWCARVDGGIQRCLPVATFATNVATATGLASEGVTPTPTAQDAQQGLRIADILDACDPLRTLCGSETCINESCDEYLRGTKENVARHKARMAATVDHLAHMA